MFIIKTKRFFDVFTDKFVNGMALYPFILVRYPKLLKNRIFINHEKIHLRQQIEMLILPFYLWYGIEYLVRLIQYKNAYKAYANISFEREAYAKEGTFNYLKKRRFWAFLSFL